LTDRSLLDAIAARRSAGRMTQALPPREVIEQVLAAAVEAPNHHNTQPWRFFVLAGAARERFGEVLAKSLKGRIRPGTERSKIDGLIAGERAKPLRSPVVIVVASVSERDDAVTRREDFQAACAAIQNMLLAAEALGLAAIWRTGEGILDAGVKAHFGLRAEDEIAGVVYLGYAAPEAAAEPRNRTFTDKTEWRGFE
jgi:nitroreductase